MTMTMTYWNLLPLISLSFFVVGLRIASLGLMYVAVVWSWPIIVYVFNSKRGTGFSFMVRVS